MDDKDCVSRAMAPSVEEAENISDAACALVRVETRKENDRGAVGTPSNDSS